MKKLLILAAIAAAAFTSVAASSHVAATDVPIEKIAAMPHPRIFLPAVGIEKLRANAKTEVGKPIYEYAINRADWLLTQPPTPYEVQLGNRTLYYTRAVQSNCIALGVAYQMTGEKKYAARGVAEVMAAVDQPAWFRRFYLDTAEITFGVAFGYDWCFDAFTPEQRKKVVAAIIDKGVKLSYDQGDRNKTWWISAAMNQNQVIHTCLAAAMTAVAEYDKPLAVDVIKRALDNLPRSMKAAYSPNGSYPEGPGYWAYGTTFNCMFFMLLEGFGRHDLYGLDKIRGFDKTGDFVVAMTGNSGMLFSFGDTGLMMRPTLAAFYLGNHFDRIDYITDFNLKLLADFSKRRLDYYERETPLMLFYADRFALNVDRSKAPLLYYSGDNARIPIVTMRNSYDANAGYVGIKGGIPNGGHGHMDVGSFVYDADNVRWVFDMGIFNYGKMEKIAIDNGGTPQTMRMKFLHVGPHGHSVLQFDGAEQKAKAKSRFKQTDAEHKIVELDLSPIYSGQAVGVVRRWELRPGDSLIVTDTISGAKPGSVVDFHFPTLARAVVKNDKLILTSEDKRLEVTSASDVSGTWQVTPGKELVLKGEKVRKGLVICRIDRKIPPSGKLVIKTVFKPVRKPAKAEK